MNNFIVGVCVYITFRLSSPREYPYNLLVLLKAPNSSLCLSVVCFLIFLSFGNAILPGWYLGPQVIVFHHFEHMSLPFPSPA